MTEEQKDYPSQFAFIFFAKNAPLPESIETYLADEAFDLENHLIFTNKITNLKLSPQKQEHIRIEALSDDLLPSYLAYKYEANLEYGESYAQQMLADNKANLMKSESRIYLAIDGDQIVGDITAWECGDFIEMDDFSVLSHYRGQGIGSALQRRASKDFEQIILITEEENRLMYQHQGYQEVAYYWTALQSNRKR